MRFCPLAAEWGCTVAEGADWLEVEDVQDCEGAGAGVQAFDEEAGEEGVGTGGVGGLETYEIKVK